MQDHLLNKDRNVYISGYIDSDTAISFLQQAHYLASQSTAPISIYLNSVGGNVDDAIAIVNAVEWLKQSDIVVGTECTGRIIGVGVLILVAGTKGFRTIRDNAHLLLHRSAEDGIFASSPYDGVCESVVYTEYVKSALRCAKSIEKGLIIDEYVDEPKWMDAYAAQEYGIVDSITLIDSTIGYEYIKRSMSKSASRK